MDFAFFVDSSATLWVLMDRGNRLRTTRELCSGALIIAEPAHLMTSLSPVVIHPALDYHRRRHLVCRLLPGSGSCMPNGRTQMNQGTPTKESITVIGERNGLQLAIKHTVARGLGKIISRPDSLDSFDSSFDYPKPRESMRSQWHEIHSV